VASGDETGVVEAPAAQPLPVAPVATVPVDVEAIPLQVPTPPTMPGVESTPARAIVPQPAAPAAVRDEAVVPPRREPTQPAAERAAQAPVRAQPAAAPSRPRNLPDIPPITLALPLESGLELVQTSARPPEPEEEPAPAPRPKRVRPPKPAIAEEPLQIIETRREDVPPPQP